MVEDAEIRKVIGERLRETRSRLRISPAEVSAAIGCSEASLWNWENGRKAISSVSLRKLCSFYRMPADYILGLCDHPTGLPIGEFIVDQDALERAERARAVADVKDLWHKEGLVFGSKVPRRPAIVAGEELEGIRDRVAKIQKRLLGGEGKSGGSAGSDTPRKAR